MNGYAALAGALVVGMLLLGSSNSLGPDPRTLLFGQPPPDQPADFARREGVVEGHTTFVTITRGEPVVPPVEEEDMAKEVRCVENQPAPNVNDPLSKEIHEDCYVSVGPVDPDPSNEVTEAYVDEVTARVHAGAVGEAGEIREKGVLGWIADHIPFL